MNEIIVTASRRSENIREVPTAITAVGGARLRDENVVSITDLTAITPNIQISTSGTSVDINVRGIGNGNLVAGGGEPGVAVEVDGVYLGQPGLALATLLDVNRVEILRGPQGTLVGRNATGGAVDIIPNTPTKDLSYGFDVSAGADPAMVHSSAYISGPLNASGTLLGRFSAGQDYNEGYSRNLASSGPSRLDGNDDGALRGQLEWRPNESFTARLSAEYQKERDSGAALYLLGTPANTPLPTELQGFPIGNPQTRDAYVNAGSKELEAGTVSLTADWALGSGHLKALASYNKSNQSYFQDGDGSLAPFTATLYLDKAHQEYAELLYSSDVTKTFNYILGANYYDEYSVQNVQVPTEGQAIVYSAGGNVDSRSYAFFGHGQYEFLPGAKLFAGLRYTDDRKKIYEFNDFLGTDSREASWNHVTYEVGMSYDFTRLISGYAKYATGYKSGGYSIGTLAPAYNPETNSNIEVGLKGSYFKGALQANVAAFHTAYNNLQINQIVGESDSVTNAAQATLDGTEVEAVLRPIRNVRIEASGSWLNARFDQFLTGDSSRPQLGQLNLAGHELPGAPHYTASIGGYYDIPISEGTVSVGGRYDWKDRIYFSEFNIPISSQGAVGKINLFLNYKSPDARWTGSVYALNATDAEVRSNVTIVSALLGSLALGEYQPGRQVGISIGYHY